MVGSPQKQARNKGEPLPMPTPVVIGFKDQWLYLPDCGYFDISRGSMTRLVIDCDEKLNNHKGVIINPAKTCLVVVDMQNYFINPQFCDHPEGLAAVEPILRTIARCRSLNIQIVWLNWITSQVELHSVPPSVLRAFSKNRAQERGHSWGVNLGSVLQNGERALFEGTFNSELYPPLKAASNPWTDIFCRKSRMSGMWNPQEDLHRFLYSSGNNTVLFTGVNTDQCLLSTLTDAHSWGWDCILLADCTGTSTGRAAQKVCEFNIATNMGFVIDSTSLLQAKLQHIKPDIIRIDSGVGTDASAV